MLGRGCLVPDCSAQGVRRDGLCRRHSRELAVETQNALAFARFRFLLWMRNQDVERRLREMGWAGTAEELEQVLFTAWSAGAGLVPRNPVPTRSPYHLRRTAGAGRRQQA